MTTTPSFLQSNYGVQVPVYGPAKPTTPQFLQPNYGFQVPSDIRGISTEQNSTSTGGGAPAPTNNVSNPVSSGPSPEDIYKQQQVDAISNKWGSYFSSLDQMLGELPSQASTLQSTANINAGQNTSDLQASTDQQKTELARQADRVNQNQVKTLKDVSSNIRNLMQAGNTFLGAQGAGDSSAVNQYAYGLTKIGSQQRGDVQAQTQQQLGDIDARITQVGNIFTQEKQRIDSELGERMNNIATWLADQQTAIKQAKANGQLQKGTDIQSLSDNLYQMAVSKAQQYQNAYTSQQSALQTWALNNSSSLKEAQSKLASAGQFTATNPVVAPINGTPQFNSQPTSAGAYGGWSGQSLTDEQKRQLGLA